MVKFWEKIDFGKKISNNFEFFSQISIIVDFCQIFKRKFDFRQKFRKISIFSKISKNLVFSQIFEKISIWLKFLKNFDFFQNVEKFRFKLNCRKNLISVKFSKKIRTW